MRILIQLFVHKFLDQSYVNILWIIFETFFEIQHGISKNFSPLRKLISNSMNHNPKSRYFKTNILKWIYFLWCLIILTSKAGIYHFPVTATDIVYSWYPGFLYFFRHTLITTIKARSEISCLVPFTHLPTPLTSTTPSHIRTDRTEMPVHHQGAFFTSSLISILQPKIREVQPISIPQTLEHSK